MVYLPDVNVWLALASRRHSHHLPAQRWINSASSEIAFCRITQMGLLRLLTNRSAMGEETITRDAAWTVYARICRDDRVLFLPEPDGLEKRWKEFKATHAAAGNAWTDSYLAAFSYMADACLVTFDRPLSKSAERAVLLS